MKTKAFRFTRDVQHQPAAQMIGHNKGDVWFIEDGVEVHKNGTVSIRTGDGTSDSFKVGDEVEWLTDDELKPYIRDQAVSKLTEDERVVLNATKAPRCKVCGEYATVELPEDGGWEEKSGSYCTQHGDELLGE